MADTLNHTIRKVTPAGVVTTLAGRAGFFGSVDGTNNFARFWEPNGVAVDSAGNIYVANSAASSIRKMTPVGTNWVVTTIAGRAVAGGAGSADGTNTAARLNYPTGMAFDSAGNLYVADPDNHNIRKITPVGTNWVVTTLAGNASIKDQFGYPLGGYADGTGKEARFNRPWDVTVDGAGNLYVADQGNCLIRQMTLVGTNWVVSTLAGLARHPGSADGTANGARFNFPFGVTVDSTGILYVADTYNDGIRKVTSTGVVTTFAGLGGNFGSADGIGSAARFAGPSGVAVDGSGNVYVADHQTIRRVTPAGVVTTLAGLPGCAGGTNGTNSNARFNSPTGVAFDSAGNVYVADAVNNRIRKITSVGIDWVVTTLVGATDSDDAETSQGYVDGPGNVARFTLPRGVAVDGAGNLYVADTINSVIRKVTPAGFVTTLAGTAGVWGNKDATGLAAQFYGPSGIAVDTATNLYVADAYNHTIRRMTPARAVTTIAGKAGTPGSADGLGHEARFNFPSGMAVDSAGTVYVADTYNNTIRKLTLSGTNWMVTTLGGMSGFYGTADGTGSAARFSNPNGVAVDKDGNIYVADFYFNTIRKGFPATSLTKPSFNQGHFSFDLVGRRGLVVVIEASTDLMNWQRIRTNAIPGTLNFNTPQTDNSGHQFYRAFETGSTEQ